MSIYHRPVMRRTRYRYPQTRPLGNSNIQFSSLTPPPELDIVDGDTREMDGQAESEPEKVVTPQPQPQKSTQARKTRRTWKLDKGRLVSILVFLLLIGSLTLLASVTLTWLFFPSATITLSPVTKQASAQFSSNVGQVLASLREQATKTVATTGQKSQPAQSASGIITFLNGGIQPIPVPAHFLLTGRDGIQVSTDYSVNVPVGNPVGQASVSAHAVNPGSSGNIVAYDISGTTNIQNLLAKNYAAFAGGQNATTYQVVSDQDIQMAAHNLDMSLRADLTQKYQRSLPSGDALVTPLFCSQQITSNELAGARSSWVAVTLKESCQAVAYNVQSVTKVAQHALAPDGSYVLRGNMKLNVRASSASRRLEIQVSGTLQYQWSQAELRSLARLIAGKTEHEAVTLLLQQGHIVKAPLIHIIGRDTGLLPNDPARIQFIDK